MVKKSLADYQKEFEAHGITVETVPGQTESSRLSLKLITDYQDILDGRTLLITKGQLDAGLPIPLYNPDLPIFCEIISHDLFMRAIYQMNGDDIRIINEFSFRAATGTTLFDDDVKKAEYKDTVINPSHYTADNFFKNYEVIPMKKETCYWAVRLHKTLAKKLSKDELLMRDIDWCPGNNSCVRWSSDDRWDLHPLLLKGNYISGNSAIPEFLSSWRPWVLNWPERNDMVSYLIFPFISPLFPSVVHEFIALGSIAER